VKSRMKKTYTKPDTLSREDGFTLTELMVFIGIMVIFLIGVGGMITSGVKSSTASFNLVKISDGANEALSTMVRQIRVASSLDASSTANLLVFTGDVNGDGTETTVRFDVSGGYLRQGASADSMANWIPYVDSITFTYFWFDPATKQCTALAAGDWVAHYQDVYRIDIEINMSVDAVGTSIARTFSGSVTMRNMLR
jgi:type II secretory pathway component PulJ